MDTAPTPTAPRHSRTHGLPSSAHNNVGFYAGLALLFLIPIFFVPSALAPLQFSKVLLAVFITTATLSIIFYRALARGTIDFSWSLLHIGVWLLPLAYLVASLFSSNPAASFFGYELPTDTFGFILLAAFVVHIASAVFRGNTRVFSALVAFLVAAWLVFLFQIVQIAFGAPFPFLTDPSANLIGRWSDFGIFAGLVGALLLMALESIPLPKAHYVLLAATFIVSFVFLVLADSSVAWTLFGAAAFVTLVIGLSKRFLSDAAEMVPQTLLPGILSFVGFAGALFFLTIGGGAADALQSASGVDVFEVRPTFQSTISVASAIYAESPVFGSGPNTFNAAWLLHRPAEVVQTPFWNLSFNTGAGAIISSAATGGIVMAVAWSVFILLFALAVLRALFVEVRDRQSYTVVSLTVLASVYLLAAHLLAAPTAAITLLLFLFIGFFLASLSGTALVRTIAIELRSAPRFGFAFILVSIVIMLGAVGASYMAGKAYLSVYRHNQGVAAANRGDLAGGLEKVASAIRLDAQDRYFRTISLINIAEMNRLVQSGGNDGDMQAAFQQALTNAVEASNAAVALDPRNFANLMTRGLIFETVVPLQIDGAFENALATYDAARAVNPNDPEVDWRSAALHAASGDTESARARVEAALSKKADYTNAILLLAQIELDEGNLAEAIDSVRAAVFFEPTNPTLLYQLGILLLQDRAYSDASVVLEETLRLQPEFANASFFLAQAYAFLNRFEEAEAVMRELAVQNPDNQTVLEYRRQLADGENPFDTAPIAPNEDEGTIE